MNRYGTKLFKQSIYEARHPYFATDSMILTEASNVKSQSEYRNYDVFLSHSSKDKILALNFRKELEKQNISCYIDWIEDSESGRDKITPVLRKAMTNSKTLLYLHTHNSINSKWTPWEIGFFDSKKTSKYIGVVPFENESNGSPKYDGQEYLLQYNEIGSDYIINFIRNGLPT